MTAHQALVVGVCPADGACAPLPADALAPLAGLFDAVSELAVVELPEDPQPASSTAESAAPPTVNR